MKRAPLIVVLYDSITNSVFQSQVMLPLLKERKEQPSQPIIILSFEKKIISQKLVDKIAPNQIIKIIIKKRSPLFSLWFAQKALRNFLYMIPEYRLLARGPLAGYICLKVADTRCKKLTIQARGLVAQEYRFTHQKSSFILKMIHFLRFKKLLKLEQYCFAHTKANLEIQAVSPAMKEYVIKNYKTNPNKITLATQDIPQKIQPAHVAQWKKEIRELLQIPDESYVYCYNGSAKPWQCIDKVIDFFKEEMPKNESCFLLIVTQDCTTIKNIIAQHMIPENKYKIVTVEHNDIYKYLSAADAGILFRDEHIINWVSRPTKLLEYQSVGLKIIHNKTVEYAQR